MKKNWVIIIVVALTLVSLAVFFYFHNQSDYKAGSGSIEAIEKSPEVAAKPKLIIGNPSTPVTILEYGDFKCPICNVFFQTTESQVQKELIDTGKAKIEYRTYPIIAEDSKLAAQAAYCSNDQSKFSSYHAALFNSIWNAGYKNSNYSIENEDYFNLKLLTDLAGSVGMDTTSFQSCLSSGKYAATVTEDTNLAKKAGVSSTPTFFINSEKIVGAQPFSIINSIVKAKSQ